MSASDAAPLPRLGEVFFDVRGSSRSMRLSWYSDTGVAVFSIWQGGMCTGTFRLPIGDLPRMIEILQRGPDGERSRSRQDHRERGWAGRESAGTGQRDIQPSDPRYPDEGVRYGDEDLRYAAEDPRYADARYPDEPLAGYRRADAAQPSAASYAGEDQPRSRAELPRSQPGGYGLDDSRGPRSLRHGPGDYGQPSGSPYVTGDIGGDPYGRYQPPPSEEPEPAGHRRDDSGYEQERFVPPYVRGAVGEYVSDIPRRPADLPDDSMQTAYRDDPKPGPSPEPDYLRQPWPPEGYSDGPQYR